MVPQAPSIQSQPGGQRLPQEPQLLTSDVRFRQTPLHRVSMDGHWQNPLLQVRPLSHVWPQVRQLFESINTFVHCPLHSSNRHRQAPPTHRRSPVQTFPQVRQFRLSLWVSIQAPRQLVSPGGQSGGQQLSPQGT
jgi:hypothetical protein